MVQTVSTLIGECPMWSGLHCLRGRPDRMIGMSVSAKTVVMMAGLYLLVACAPAPQLPREYEVLGLISEIPEDRSSAVLLHDTIPGYMESMTMPFSVTDSSLLDGVEVGTEVRFHLVVDANGAVISGIEEVLGYSEPFPEFELSTLEGRTISSSQLDGKVAVINFWASWCAPCREEMPWLVEMTDVYDEAEFSVVGITEDPENTEAIAEFIVDIGVNYPIVMTDFEVESKAGGVYGIPTTFILDRSGRVAYKHVGLGEEEELRSRIESLF